VLLGAAPPAWAQPETPDTQRTAVEEDGTAVKITHTLDTRITLTTQFPPSLKCQASMALSYAQRNTVADVDGTIENDDCAASSGDYTIAVSTRDDSGEVKVTEFSATWERSDDQPIEFEAAYPIDENVDLVRVRSRRISCVCAEPPQAQPAAE
jgi:hypothetical protein